MPVAVVTDSSAYLPDGFANRHAVHVVPIHVLIDDCSGRDGVDIGPADVAAALTGRRSVTTSRPNPEEFAQTYRRLLDEGADEIVSIHLSRELSGTWESARLAAKEVGDDMIRVVDSRTAVMGLGFSVLRAASAAGSGASGAAVEDAAVAAAARTRTFFMVETLDYLRRGGRIGSAAAIFGTALAVKPVLHVKDGHIVLLEKVRTTNKALARLVDLAEQAAAETGADAVELAVHHLAAHERAAELATRLDERIAPASGCVVSELGGAIGAHTGPGMLGVVICPADG